MNYSFWYGAYDAADLEWLSHSVTMLRQNDWKADKPLFFDGIGWASAHDSVREGAALLLLNALEVNTTVRTIVLRNANFDLKASKALLGVLGRTCHLHSISLKHIRFNSQPMEMPPILFDNWCLQKLSLEECTLHGESCAALGKMLRKSREIRSLTLQNVKLGSSAWIAGLKHSRSLTTLTLHTMSLSEKSMQKLFAALTENASLTSVKLENMNLSENHAEALALLLTRNKHLQKLSLRKNNFSGSTAMKWIMSLKENTSLKTLYLSHNSLGGHDDDGSCVELIVSALQQNSTLKTLCLIGCEISKLGCECIARGIASFPGLHHLSVDGNSMEQCGAQLETSLRCHNTVLRHVLCCLPTLLLIQEEDESAVWKRVDFYLRLNKANRSALNAADRVPDLLPNLLCKGATAAEPDVLFHFLSSILPPFASSDRAATLTE